MLELKQYLDRELPEINAYLDARTRELDPLVRPVAAHVFGAGGKRFRPLLTILTARCLGLAPETDVYPLACSLEILHSATLIHDDILDGASLRRGVKAAHLEFGQAETILAGDVLLALANRLVAEYGMPLLIRHLAEAIMRTAAGEIHEIARLNHADVGREEYLEIIAGKTAYLIQAACRCGAILAGVDQALESAAADFGLNLGVAFQLVDDAIDYSARSDVSGKPVGGDLKEGKYTLPLILYLESLPESERKDLVDKLKNKNLGEDELNKVITEINSGGFAARTIQAAADFAEKAKASLEKFPDRPEKKILGQALAYVLSRNK